MSCMYTFYLAHAHSAYREGYVFRVSVHLFTGGVSGKVHYEHILATEVLMPMGGGGWVSGIVHYEHILATKVLIPLAGGGVWENALLR